MRNDCITAWIGTRSQSSHSLGALGLRAFAPGIPFSGIFRRDPHRGYWRLLALPAKIHSSRSYTYRPQTPEKPEDVIIEW